jgi:hypothetical protein
MNQLLGRGQKIVPLLQERFNETGNTRYFYLMQKLSNTRVSTSAEADKWDKSHYFRQKYQEAQNAMESGESERAIKLAEAILTLEPQLDFAEEVKRFISDLRDMAQQVLYGEMKAERDIYVPGETVQVQLRLSNPNNSPVAIHAGDNGIVLQVYVQEFTPAGSCVDHTLSHIIPLTGQIILTSRQIWQSKVAIPNPVSDKAIYRVIHLKAAIPRCQVQQEDRRLYPRIVFRPVRVAVLPRPFHDVVRQPIASALYALRLGYAEHLFFAAFFVDRQAQAELIPAMIERLGTNAAMDQVITAILRRVSGQNLSGRNAWHNYWQANGASWAKHKASGEK